MANPQCVARPRQSIDVAPETQNAADTGTWLAEHERALHQLRNRIGELERDIETTNAATIPQALAIAAIAALPLAACMPWLRTADTAASGWTLLLASVSDPFSVSAIYAVAAAMLAQGLALFTRIRVGALAAAITCALASVTLTSFAINSARDNTSDPGAGAIVCIGVLCIASAAWGVLASVFKE